MSILLRDGPQLKLYVKGADNVVIDRLKKNDAQPYKDIVASKLHDFSQRGYRTLVYAMRMVSEDEYKQLRESLDDVATADNREDKIGRSSYIINFSELLFSSYCK